MNGIISDKLHELEEDNSIDNKNEKEIFFFIFDKINNISQILKPNNCIGIFVDGVSPKAKMNLQRQRRVREFSKYKNKCSFNFNNISTGTKFMENLSHYLQEKINEEKKKDSLWKKVKVIFSGPEVPGEAEYKIFEYIRNNRNSSSSNIQFEKRCICTTDSDFYLLSLAYHQRNILIYNMYNQYYSKRKIFFSIDKFRLSILKNFFPNADKEEENKIIDDFICFCFLTENNYLPGVHDVSLDDIIDVYKENYKTIGFINNNGKLNEANFKKLLILLNKRTDQLNKMLFYLDKEMKNSSFNYEDKQDSIQPEDENNIIKFGKYIYIYIIFFLLKKTNKYLTILINK